MCKVCSIFNVLDTCNYPTYLYVVCTSGLHTTILDVERTTSDTPTVSETTDSSSHLVPPPTPSGKECTYTCTYMLILVWYFNNNWRKLEGKILSWHFLGTTCEWYYHSIVAKSTVYCIYSHPLFVSTAVLVSGTQSETSKSSVGSLKSAMSPGEHLPTSYTKYFLLIDCP